MARFTAILALSASFIGFAGCAKEWSRPGTTEQELNMDQLACEQEAMRLYPVVHDAPVTYRPPAPSKLDTNCVQQSGFNNCNNPGNASAPDANDYNRAAAVRACLESKGYKYGKAR